MKRLRIDSLELSWFRGAGDHAEIAVGGRSCVVYGDNASGKSSFVDGFEYVLEMGRIEHLRNEYADRSGQRNCVRNTSAPDDVDAKSIVNFVDGNNVFAVIPSDGRISYGSSSDGLLDQFRKWKRPSHVLRQDEVGEFIEKSKGQKYNALIPLLGLQRYEDIFNNFVGLEKQLIERSELENIRTRRQWIQEELEKKVRILEKDKIIAEFKTRAAVYDVVFSDLLNSSDSRYFLACSSNLSLMLTSSVICS